MAVELCKVSLWMEAVEPGLPLTFLISHIQHGNALLGTTPELMAKGIPDAAWEPIEGDDKKIASALRKRNKKAAEGQRSLDSLWSQPGEHEAQAVTRAIAEFEASSDADAAALASKESKWEGILESAEYLHQKLVADTWCAAFVWPEQSGALDEGAPTNELWRRVRDGQGQPPALTVKTTEALAKQYNFLHWHLAFPQVFERGGSDVVLGNPPWERVKLQEQEFFATKSDEIAGAVNAAARKKLIAEFTEKLELDAPSALRPWRPSYRANLSARPGSWTETMTTRVLEVMTTHNWPKSRDFSHGHDRTLSNRTARLSNSLSTSPASPRPVADQSTASVEGR